MAGSILFGLLTLVLYTSWNAPASVDWIANSGHAGIIDNLYYIDDVVLSVGRDGTIVRHAFPSLHVAAKITTQGNITSSAMLAAHPGIIIGHSSGAFSIVRVGNSQPSLDLQPITVRLGQANAITRFSTPIDAIAVLDDLDRMVLLACSAGKCYLIDVDLIDLSILATREIHGLYYSSRPSVAPRAPDQFVLVADNIQGIQLIRFDSLGYTLQEIKSASLLPPRYSGVSISPSGNLVCTQSWRGQVLCVSLVSNNELWSSMPYPPGEHCNAFWFSDTEVATFSAQSDLYHSAGLDRWNVELGTRISHSEFQGQHLVQCILLTPDKLGLIVGTLDGRIGKILLVKE